MTTWADIKGQLVQAAGGDSTVEPVLMNWFNTAQREVARWYRFPELACETTIEVNPGSEYYNLEDDVLELQAVHIWHDNRWKPLQFVPLRKWWKYVMPELYVVRARPRNYTLWGRSLRLFPIPGVAYTLKYFATVLPARITKDEDTVTLETCLEGLIALTLGLYFDSIEELQTASMWKNVAREFFRTAKITDLHIPGMPHNQGGKVAPTPPDELYKVPFPIT